MFTGLSKTQRKRGRIMSKQTTVNINSENREIIRKFHAEDIAQTGVYLNFSQLTSIIFKAGIESLRKESIK